MSWLAHIHSVWAHFEDTVWGRFAVRTICTHKCSVYNVTLWLKNELTLVLPDCQRLVLLSTQRD